MSLTLEEVRRVRFRMARPRETGYAVADVDNFIDKVEESFAAFENDRDLLRRELDSASATGGGAPAADNSAELEEARGAVEAKDAELAEMRQEIERLQRQAEAHAPTGDVDEKVAQLTAVNEQLEAQNAQLGDQLEKTRAELNQARNERITSAAGTPQQITVHASEDAAPAVTRLLQMATDQATTLVAEAETEAGRKLADAEQRATEIKTDARTRAERIESEARVNAEQVTNEAESRAAKLNGETAARREELFAELEHEQGVLTGKVDSLRGFEQQYRSNLGGSLQQLLSALEEDHPQPLDVPELAEAPSETPRLDALASDSQE